MNHDHEHQAVPTQEQVAQTPSSSAPALSAFIKVSIVILVSVTVASISLLFIGDLEGKFERVFSTLALFTIFVLLTAFDTRRERAAHWYAPIALIANAYILGLLLIIIWVTPYEALVLQFRITWTSVYVIVVTRVVVWGVGALLRIGTRRPSSVARWGQVTSVFAILTLILFTAPLGIQAFQVHVPDLYWRIAVATLILTGLGLAVTLLLSWYYRPEKPAEHRQQTGLGSIPPGAPAPSAPYAQAAPHAQDAPVPTVAGQAAQPAAQPERLPWPTFADGAPYPMGPDGQPDFAAAERMQANVAPAPAHPATSEEQLHEPARMNGDVNDSVVPAEPAVAASSVLAEDPGIQAESVVTQQENDPAPAPEPSQQGPEEAIHLPEMSRGEPEARNVGEDDDPLDETTSKRST